MRDQFVFLVNRELWMRWNGVVVVKDWRFSPVGRTLCDRGVWWGVEGKMELKDRFLPRRLRLLSSAIA